MIPSHILFRIRVLLSLLLLVIWLVFGSRGVVAAELQLATLNNQETVTQADFDAYLARRADLKPLARNFWGAESALREMLLTRALVLEGQSINEPVQTGNKLERFDDGYGLIVFRKLVSVCPSSVDEKSARAFYDMHPEVFTTPATARLARVMLPVSQRVDGMLTMEWLMIQAEDVAKGARNFDALASKAASLYKLEPQGDLGWVNLIGDVPIMRALMAAKSGEMVGPVRDGDFGYLFLLGEKREPRLLKWDEVKTTAAARQVRYCREQANNELREKLFKKYHVSIDENAVKALFKISSPSKSAEPKK